MNEVIVGKRRFTCLSPRLVRMEFSPNGVFEDRHSVVANQERHPLPFDEVRESNGETILKVGQLTITSRQNDQEFFPLNLQVDWKLGDLTQTWCYGDRDYRNLGGTVRSLDNYQRDGILSGVHPASNASPDEFFHPHNESYAVHRIYEKDGKTDWIEMIDRQGVYSVNRYTPELIYNRFQSMIDDLTQYQPGLLSRSGYFLLNDSTGAVLDEDNFPIERNTPGTRDLYFFGYGLDFKAALRDFTLLSGPIPLPAKNIFGIIFCRWPAFNEQEARSIITRFEQEGIPLSVLVIDLEWHIPDWWHWDWNPQTYPNPEAFLRWAHSRNVQVALNVHPDLILSTDAHFKPYLEASGAQAKVAPVPEEFQVDWMLRNGADRCVPIDMSKKKEVQALMKVCCEPIIRQGADFWWLDGSSGYMNGADTQILASKAYYESSEVDGRRGMLLGRYGGLGSHRYGAFFTGDTHSQWEVLRSQCEFNIRAGQVGMAYVSHDIGGFFHDEAPLIDPNLYIRWLEFGVFNPIMRFHSAPGAGSRLPWDYGARNEAIAKHWLAVRNSFAPYLYVAARQAYETGLPIVRGLYLEDPLDEASYRFDQYYFGDSLLVAPVLGQENYRTVYLPAGMWYDFETGKLHQGGHEMKVFASLQQIPVYVKAGSILVRQEAITSTATNNSESISKEFPTAHVEHLLLDVYPGGDGEAVLYEDDNKTQAYQSDGYGKTCFTLRDTDRAIYLQAGTLEGKAYGVNRQIRLRIAMEAAPVEVTFNGASLPTGNYGYDRQSNRLTIDLGPCSVDQPWEVIIRK